MVYSNKNKYLGRLFPPTITRYLIGPGYIRLGGMKEYFYYNQFS